MMTLSIFGDDLTLGDTHAGKVEATAPLTHGQVCPPPPGDSAEVVRYYDAATGLCAPRVVTTPPPPAGFVSPPLRYPSSSAPVVAPAGGFQLPATIFGFPTMYVIGAAAIGLFVMSRGK